MYGAGGYGRGVMPLLREYCSFRDVVTEQVVFIDDVGTSSINGHQVLSYEAFLKLQATAYHVVVAIGNSTVREKLMRRCLADNVRLITLVANTSIVMDNVEIGAGAILNPFVTIAPNVKIGLGFQGNMYSSISHDCRIGDFVTFAPGVRCNGSVVVEDHAYIGSGAIIRHAEPERPIVIGRGAIVGMGAVVTCSVPPGMTVVGNPARLLEHA